ncbi:unnamed protein product [Trichobilharzia regenti]|nr:unnamed protein product [Trichobilharzia regenti]
MPESCLQDTVLPANLAWLRDPAWCVRECACRSLARLLVACPSACKKAFNGVGSKTSTSSASGGSAASNPGGGSSSASSNTNPSGGGSNASNSSSSSSGNPSSASANAAQATDQANASASSNASTNPANALTSQAAAGGLKALATDPNYHLRQIYINVVQVSDDIKLALGDDPSAGILFPASRNIYAYLSSKASKHSSLSSSTTTTNSDNTNTNQSVNVQTIPKGCQPPPQQIPAVHLTTCVAQLLRFLSEDVVPNVRICATQALQTESKRYLCEGWLIADIRFQCLSESFFGSYSSLFNRRVRTSANFRECNPQMKTKALNRCAVRDISLNRSQVQLAISSSYAAAPSISPSVMDLFS